MESIIPKLSIGHLKPLSVLRQYLRKAFVAEFEADESTSGGHCTTASRWNNAAQESYALRLMMDILERRDKEEHADGN